MKSHSILGACSIMLLIVIALVFQNCSRPKLSSHDALSREVDLGSSAPVEVGINKANQTDSETPDCTEAVLLGLKCLNTTVVTEEGQAYKVQIKWSRPNMDSKGSVLMAVGGSGGGPGVETRNDPPSRFVLEKLSQIDQVRVIQLDFVDPQAAGASTSGYFTHAGGYRSAAQAFVAAVKLIKEKQIIRGNFLNYLGGSNATMVASYAMTHFGLDKTFDRVVLQMGPFLPSLQSACNPNSTDSFYKNNPDQVNLVFQLLNNWRYGNPNQNICSDLSNDRMSVLGPVRIFPNTHVHVIVGALEVQHGFGAFILNSNEVWFNSITAKSKERIIRPEIGHNNSYKDMRRYLRLSANETAIADDPDYRDNEGQFCDGALIIKYNCRAGAQIQPPTIDPNVKWVDAGKGCFHLATSQTCVK